MYCVAQIVEIIEPFGLTMTALCCLAQMFYLFIDKVTM